MKPESPLFERNLLTDHPCGQVVATLDRLPELNVPRMHIGLKNGRAASESDSVFSNLESVVAEPDVNAFQEAAI